MATIFNFGFEGTNGTTVTTGNSGFTTVSAGTGGTLTYQTGTPAVGSSYVRTVIGATATSSNMTKTITTPSAIVGGRIRFRLQAFQNNLQVISMRITGGASMLVRVTTAGKLNLHNSTTSVVTGTLTHALGDWVTLEFMFGGGKMTVKMINPDGTNETISGATPTATSYDQFRCGIQPSLTNVTLDYDDLWLDTGTALGTNSNGAGQSFVGAHGTSKPLGTNSNGAGASLAASVGRGTAFLVSQGQGATFVAQKGAQSVLALSNGFGAAFGMAKSAVGVLLGTNSNGVNVTSFTGRKGSAKTFGTSDGVTLALLTSRSAARQFALSNGAGLAFVTRHGGSRTFNSPNAVRPVFTARRGGSLAFAVSNGAGATFVLRRGANRSFTLVAGADFLNVVATRPHLVSFALSNGYVITLTSVVGGHGFYDDNLHIGPPEGRSARVSIAQHWRAGPPTVGSMNASL